MTLECGASPAYKAAHDGIPENARAWQRFCRVRRPQNCDHAGPAAAPLGPRLARAVADRRLGIGCDQVIVIETAHDGGDAGMRILNADGSEAEACGNAARCVARLLMEEKDAVETRIETATGLLHCVDAAQGCVTVDMGVPRLDWKSIPLAREVDTEGFRLNLAKHNYLASAVSVGNPHCVLFVNDAG